MEAFVDCHIFQLTRKSSDAVYITHTRSVIPLCLLPGMAPGCVICAAMILPLLSAPCQPQGARAHSPGAVGDFFPAGGQTLEEICFVFDISVPLWPELPRVDQITISVSLPGIHHCVS